MMKMMMASPRVNTSPDVSPNDSAANASFSKTCVSRPYVEHAPVSRERRGYPLFRENGFVCSKIISDEAVQLLRASLEEAFSREIPVVMAHGRI